MADLTAPTPAVVELTGHNWRLLIEDGHADVSCAGPCERCEHTNEAEEVRSLPLSMDRIPVKAQIEVDDESTDWGEGAKSTCLVVAPAVDDQAAARLAELEQVDAAARAYRRAMFAPGQTEEATVDARMELWAALGADPGRDWPGGPPRSALMARVFKLEQERDLLHKTVAWYADQANYNDLCPGVNIPTSEGWEFEEDGGLLARRALASITHQRPAGASDGRLGTTEGATKRADQGTAGTGADQYGCADAERSRPQLGAPDAHQAPTVTVTAAAMIAAVRRAVELRGDPAPLSDPELAAAVQAARDLDRFAADSEAVRGQGPDTPAVVAAALRQCRDTLLEATFNTVLATGLPGGGGQWM